MRPPPGTDGPLAADGRRGSRRARPSASATRSWSRRRAAAAASACRSSRISASSRARCRPAPIAARARSATRACTSSATCARRKHIEVQVLCDAHGSAVALGERECSVQRRHQKIVEESPSPAPFFAGEAGEAQRRRSLRRRAARRHERRLRRRGHGGVRRAAPTGELFFLEVNARLQVEHCVTEMVHRARSRRAAAPRRRGRAALAGGARRKTPRGTRSRRASTPRIPRRNSPRSRAASRSSRGRRRRRRFADRDRRRGGERGHAVLRSDDREDRRVGARAAPRRSRGSTRRSRRPRSSSSARWVRPRRTSRSCGRCSVLRRSSTGDTTRCSRRRSPRKSGDTNGRTMSELLTRAQAWVDADPDPDTRAELARLIELAAFGEDAAQKASALRDLGERFAGPLEFGTAGLRGVIGAGETRMNRAVVRRTTAGLARYLLAEDEASAPRAGRRHRLRRSAHEPRRSPRTRRACSRRRAFRRFSRRSPALRP